MSGLGWEFFAGVCVVAAVYIMVRPDSGGPAMVSAFTDGLGSLISYTAGGLA